MTELERVAEQYANENSLVDEVPTPQVYEEAFKAGAEWQYEQFEKERLKHCDELTEEREKTKLKAMTEEQREHISLVILGDVTTIRCDESEIYIDDFISYGQMAEIVDYLRKEEQQ